MTDTVLERRPLYAIGTVARLTGLKPDTLRVWERRYGLGASHKSASGRRQYTQGDLEHLQLVAALVANGARIGEIAGAGRKTLEALLRQIARNGEAPPEPKPRIAFVGGPLCDWLHRHQGCLVGVDALLLRAAPEAMPGRVREHLTDCDALVLFTPRLGAAAVESAVALRASLGAGRAILAYERASRRDEARARAADLGAMQFPPEPGHLTFELSRCAVENLARRGVSNVGELVPARPREFSAAALAAAAGLGHAGGCECPSQLAQLAASLASFESVSARCSTESWRDAAVHARVYAFTAQARWLIERALRAVLEEREADFARALARQSSGGDLGDAA